MSRLERAGQRAIPLATPKPEARLTPTADEFAAWCEQPVTRWVAAAFAHSATAAVDEWTNLLSFGKPENLALAQKELRTRADAYLAFLQTNHARYLQILDPQAWKETYGEARN